MPSTIPKSECVHDTALWLGLFSMKTKATLSLVFRFCDCSCGHWPVSVKNVNPKIRLGGPKSGRTLLFSSKRWKESLILWRFLQREKEKSSKSVRRQARIGAGYLRSPHPNWLSLHKLSMTTHGGLELTWICCFVVLVVVKPCKALLGAEKGIKGSLGRNPGWAVHERLCMSGWNGPTKTITKRTATSKPHLQKGSEHLLYFYE